MHALADWIAKLVGILYCMIIKIAYLYNICSIVDQGEILVDLATCSWSQIKLPIYRLS